MIIPSHVGNKRILRPKSILVDSNNKIAGFRVRIGEDLPYEYISENITPARGYSEDQTSDNMTEFREFPITEEVYKLAIESIREHKLVITTDLSIITPEMYPLSVLEFAHEDTTLDNYKTLKCAELIYYYRQKLYKPIEYNGNFFDTYYLRNNYYDMRLIQEMSTDMSVGNTIKLTTINNVQVVLTSEEFLTFYKSFTSSINNILNTQSEQLNNIMNASTKEDIDTIIQNAKVDRPIHYPSNSIFMPIYENANTYMNFVEAPNDGKAYVRQNKKWTEANVQLTSPITITGTNIENKIEEAPNDSDCYVRNQTKWKKIITRWKVGI